MKIAKRIWAFLAVCAVLLSFSLYCLGAEIVRIESHRAFDYLHIESRSVNFRKSFGDMYDLKGDSYAMISNTSDTEAFEGIECSTCAVNEFTDSIYDHLYLTAAYVSLSIALESGETLFAEKAVRCEGDSCVLAEVSATDMNGFDQNDVIKDFESHHMIYNRMPKYSIEFDHGKVWIETIIFEAPEETSARGRVE